MSSREPERITVDQLVERFAVLLLDAYGVLVHHEGALPGAAELVTWLNRSGKPYHIVTNDASRLPGTSAARFRRMGLAIPEERIITSGSLLAPYFARHGLEGARCLVLGPEDSARYVSEAGGEVVTPEDPLVMDADVLVVCDEVGYRFVETVDRVLSALFRRFDAGRPMRLLLPNPDLVYPKGDLGSYGITAGSIARLLEGALRQRYPGWDEVSFVRLGKPAAPIFVEAVRRARVEPSEMVMVGDQLDVDIKGANDFGIPSALVSTGLTRPDQLASGEILPTYVVEPWPWRHRAGC
jgi:HAD superfamily hydrolase (TIGR01450 family)